MRAITRHRDSLPISNGVGKSRPARLSQPGGKFTTSRPDSSDAFSLPSSGTLRIQRSSKCDTGRSLVKDSTFGSRIAHP